MEKIKRIINNYSYSGSQYDPDGWILVGLVVIEVLIIYLSVVFEFIKYDWRISFITVLLCLIGLMVVAIQIINYRYDKKQGDVKQLNQK